MSLRDEIEKIIDAQCYIAKNFSDKRKTITVKKTLDAILALPEMVEMREWYEHEKEARQIPDTSINETELRIDYPNGARIRIFVRK